MESTEKTKVVTENKKENKENSKKEKETKAASTEVEKVDDTAADEVNLDELFKKRESIRILKDNAWFSRSEGGLISLKIINAEGEEETFEHVRIVRSFPITSPNSFISVREVETKKAGRGSEIGMIYDINDLDKETIALLNSELEVRYFIPEITAITSNRRKQGYIFWDLETKSGKASIVMNNPYSNLKVLENGSVLVYDMDGRCFSIPDPQKLDHQSHKILSEYLF